MTFVHPVLHDPYSCSTPYKPVVVGTEIFSPSVPLLFSRGLLSLLPIASVQFSRGVAASGNTAGKPLPVFGAVGHKTKPVRRDQNRNLKRILWFMIEPIRRHHEEQLLVVQRYARDQFISVCCFPDLLQYRPCLPPPRHHFAPAVRPGACPLKSVAASYFVRTPLQEVSLKST